MLVPPSLDGEEGGYILVADRELAIFRSASIEEFEGVEESLWLHDGIGVLVGRKNCTEEGREREYREQ